jgi:2-hydroxychromene-2-carboxylate isomerase
MSVRDRLTRRVMPRLVVALSTVRRPRRLAASVRRAFGGRGRVDLYVAFDDAQSAVALAGLLERVAARRVDLRVRAVVERGIRDDPAAEAKRRYAVADARRLARRDGLELTRAEPVAAADAAFLAEWAGVAPGEAERTAFAAAAMRQLWFGSDGSTVEREPYAELWREHVGGEPPSGGAASATGAEKLMRRRRLYDTPVAVVHGQWFFAHERLPQIEHRLDELGWTVRP